MDTTTKNFRLGQTVITSNALQTLVMDDVVYALRRHQRGDWGVVSKADAELNDESLLTDCRVLSAYIDRNDVRFWIITEADRSVTTVLLPEDY